MYGPLFYFAGIIAAGVLGGLFLFAVPSVETVEPLSESEWAALEQNAPIPTPDPVPLPASLLVESAPGDALVYVDSVFGGLTPYRLDDVAAGWHAITVRKDGFAPSDTMVHVKAGQAVGLLVALLPDPRASTEEPTAPPPVASTPPATVTGALRIITEPAGATIRIDGRRAGTAPRLLDDLDPGSHTIELSLADHAPQTLRVVVGAGKRSIVRADLVPLTGTLSMIVRPWGTLYIDGVLHVRDTDLRHDIAVPVGSHVVRAVHPVLGAQEWRVEVEVDRTTTVDFDLN